MTHKSLSHFEMANLTEHSHPTELIKGPFLYTCHKLAQGVLKSVYGSKHILQKQKFLEHSYIHNRLYVAWSLKVIFDSKDH